jgi:hypothetical protein
LEWKCNVRVCVARAAHRVRAASTVRRVDKTNHPQMRTDQPTNVTKPRYWLVSPNGCWTAAKEDKPAATRYNNRGAGTAV